jgi:hypothetical protein
LEGVERIAIKGKCLIFGFTGINGNGRFEKTEIV